ncbi:MAG: methylmalonyl-CoA mutase, partial [Notoacmeibacter sp.]|nr:methylmalonyl-CoA mutase [Notoacmeibacter sp.]
MEASIIKNAQFEAADRATWAAAAKKALKGADFDETLIARSDDGLPVGPVYGRAEGFRQLPRVQAHLPWHIVQRIDDPDPARAREQVVADLEGGATGISLVFEGAPNALGYGLPMDEAAVRSIMDVIPVETTHLRVDVHPASRVTLDWMVPILARKRVDPSKLSLSFGIDPAAIFAGTGRLRMSIEALKASMPQSMV